MNAVPTPYPFAESFSPRSALSPHVNKTTCGGLFESSSYTLVEGEKIEISFKPLVNLVLIVSGQINVTASGRQFSLASGEIWLVKEDGDCKIENNVPGRDAAFITIRLHFAMLSRFKERYEQALLSKITQSAQIDYMHTQKRDEFIFSSCDLTRMAADSFRVFSTHGDDGLFALKLEELLLIKLNGKKGHLLAILMLNRCDPALERYRRFIEENVLNDWSLSTYAKEAGMSLTSFKVMFSRVFQGASPKTWINERRLRFADAQVRTTRKRLIDIAMEAGFSSQSYFTQSYKARFGESPSEVRQRA